MTIPLARPIINVSAAAPLTQVFTIPAVARMAKWSRWAMERHLVSCNKDRGGMLLVNVSRGKKRPRWTITLGALKGLHPQWFFDPEHIQGQIEKTKEDVADLRGTVRQLQLMLNMQTDRIAAFVAGRTEPLAAAG